MGRTPALPLALALALASCTALPFLPGPKPDDNTGLVGVPTEEGSLAGRWALVIEFATVVTLPLLGDRNGGSQGLRLLTRTWDPGSKTYADEFVWCANDVFEVEGTSTKMTRETLSRLRPQPMSPTVDHALGVYNSNTINNLLGVQNLPDPLETPLPTKDNYQQEPQSTWMLDEDGDGNPGVTAHMVGAINADAYVCSRSTYVLDGTVITPDRIQGLTRASKSQQHTVAGTSQLIVGESKVRPDVNPKNSWFDMVRLADDADCDDVIQAQEDGRLARTRPF